MNLSQMLNEERYQTTIYLNDRPYDVLDIGEGSCLIIIVINFRLYIKEHINTYSNQRVIVVDIEKMLHCDIDGEGTVEQLLADDLHLLLDVFWLEEVEFKSEVSGIKMDIINKIVNVRNYSRSLLR